MNSREYWLLREAEALKIRVTDEKEYQKEIDRIYQNMLDACQKEIESFYAKYAKAEGITIAEAKKRVAKHDVKAFERKAAKYVKEKDFSPKANEELRLYNATMRINRLEMLKANIGLETIAGHDELERFMAGILKDRTEDELRRQAGILGKTVLNNAQKSNAIVNGSFRVANVGDRSTFSDRIWQYQDNMRQDLGKLLQQGLIQGKNPRALTKDLRQYWYGKDPKTGGGAKYCMERLMRTELARVQTEAQKQSFIRNGFEHYEFIVNTGCCPICLGLNGKHFRVDKMMPGENAPPMHPNCRCSTAAWEDDEEYEAWLDYLESGGTTEDWKKKKAAAEEKQGGKRLNIFRKALENSKTGTIMNSDSLRGIGIQFFASKEKQYGKKIGKHASDYGLDPSKGEDRDKMLEIIRNVVKNCDMVKTGPWRGQDRDVVFYIKGEDVVICKEDEEFVTILKGGVNNARIKNARRK